MDYTDESILNAICFRFILLFTVIDNDIIVVVWLADNMAILFASSMVVYHLT
jgi:hypothetical protein